MAKRGRKANPNLYWGEEQEQAVVDFLSVGEVIEIQMEGAKTPARVIWSGDTTEERERNRIYRDCLMKPLNKMVESIIRRYKLYSKHMEYEDLHSDTLSFLIMKFHKFKPDKNKKSYSYFGTIIKRYLIGTLMKEDKKMRTLISYEDISTTLENDEELSYSIDDYTMNLGELMGSVSKEIKKELVDNILSDNEINVGTALIKILDDWENLFDTVPGNNKFNKNLILYYMREMTSLSTKDIRNSMKRYKVIYEVIKKDLI
jgi:hypothetical protein